MRLLPVVLGGLLFASSAPPEQDIQVSGTAGWGGRAQPGESTPVLIDLDNRGKKDVDLTLTVTWASGMAYQAQEKPTLGSVAGRMGPIHTLFVPLPAKSRKRIYLTVLAPDLPASVWAFAEDAHTGSFLAGGELTVRMLDPNQRIVAVVGRSRPEGLEGDTVKVANLLPDELPEEWQGYSSLDALLWLDGRATEFRSPASIDALKQWVSTGGKLFLCRANTVDLAGTALADLLPVTLGTSRPIESLGGGHLPEGGAAVLESTVRRGAIRAQSFGVPLIVEAGQDAGQVTFVAFDPGSPTIGTWTRAPDFWRWLLNLGPAGVKGDPAEDPGPAAIGSPVLSQQAGQFPDVAAPQIGGLFLLIILYLIVVGPVDYLLLRALRRMEYTWFTFPVFVAFFTLFILLAGGVFIQRPGYQREIAVIDHYPESSFYRARALSAVLAPRDLYCRMEDALPLSSNYILSDRKAFSEDKLVETRILEAPRKPVENWLLNRNYTGLALADRCGTAPSPLSYRITSENAGGIELAVSNRSGKPIEHVSIVTHHGVYLLATIPPGDTVVTGGPRGPLTLKHSNPKADPWAAQRARMGYEEAKLPALREEDLNPAVKDALIDASFRSYRELDRRPSGLARGLQAQRWIDAGGSILLAWPDKADPVVRFDPVPGRSTSVTLLRFFQGPPP